MMLTNFHGKRNTNTSLEAPYGICALERFFSGVGEREVLQEFMLKCGELRS